MEKAGDARDAARCEELRLAQEGRAAAELRVSELEEKLRREKEARRSVERRAGELWEEWEECSSTSSSSDEEGEEEVDDGGADDDDDDDDDAGPEKCGVVVGLGCENGGWSASGQVVWAGRWVEWVAGDQQSSSPTHIHHTIIAPTDMHSPHTSNPSPNTHTSYPFRCCSASACCGRCSAASLG